MTILYHHRTQGRGGEGVHIRAIIDAMRRRGHKVVVVSPPGVDPYKEVERANNKAKSNILSTLWSWIGKHFPQIFFECMELFYNYVATINLSRIIKNEKIDLIYERYAFFMSAGVRAAKKHSIPFILEVNEISGIKRQRDQIMVNVAGNIERRIFKSADAIITVSSYLKSEISKRGGLRDNLYIMPNAIDLKSFDPGISSDVRGRYDLLDKTVIGFVGHFVKWDRLDRLVSIFARLLKAHPSAYLLLVGDACCKPDRLSLEKQIADLCIADNVKITGKVSRDRVPEYINAMDICVIPHSNSFGSPLVMFEFMAMGKTVVAPNIAPVTDVIVDGENGILFDMHDEEALFNALSSLIGNKSQRLRLGEAAQSSVAKSHTWDKNAERIIEIYYNLDR